MQVQKIDKMMRNALYEGIFPGGVLLISKSDKIIFKEAYGFTNIFLTNKVTNDTIFDIASLTKPLATTLAIIRLIQNDKIYLDQKISSILPQLRYDSKGNITVKNLLLHNSGIPDYRQYYIDLYKYNIKIRKNVLRYMLIKESLLHPIGKNILYSDLGFMILSWIIESVTGEFLNEFIYKEVYVKLKINNIFFNNIEYFNVENKKIFAATEFCLWRNKLLQGIVHDENAYVVGGIEGHAGLFGTVYDIYCLLYELLLAYFGYSKSGLFEKDVIKLFFSKDEKINRALGFDVPSPFNSSSGRYFSKNTVGHLGFTGTSFWMDIDKEIIIILLTNRVHPYRKNIKIKLFRPVLHDAIMENF